MNRYVNEFAFEALNWNRNHFEIVNHDENEDGKNVAYGNLSGWSIFQTLIFVKFV